MSITGPGSITATTLLAQNNMMNQLNTLSEQLGTGQAASTYSGLGSQAGLALQLTAQLAASNGYSSTAATVGTTLSIAQSVLTQLGNSSSAVQQSLLQSAAFSLDNTGQTMAQSPPRANSIKFFRGAEYASGRQLHVFRQRPEPAFSGEHQRHSQRQRRAGRLQAGHGRTPTGRSGRQRSSTRPSGHPAGGGVPPSRSARMSQARPSASSWPL